ncbi:alpha/beta hydrolase [Psychrobacter sp. AOP3-A1-26]|uniref:alpha/beta hydrolase n=1 Tax=Psychrobacter sp. AOP3-A1-26 TaxID=3457700 RepID=UPI00403549AC
MAGIIMSPSYAKPDLTKTVDMSLLHAKDTGYRFVYHTFSAPAPELPSSSVTNLQSKMLQAYAKPRHYQVWLAIPEQTTDHLLSNNSVKTPSKVLYMLDGNAAIDDLDKDILLSLAHSSTQGTAPVLVFIGYQSPYRFDVDARAYDYTPPLLANTTDNNAFTEEGRERLNGGAEQFYELIEKEIKPWVYEQLGEKSKQEAIWGHSYGGLFVLYNLFKHPEAYQQYFSADPSLWWQNGEMINYWQAYQNLPKAQLADISNNKHKQIRLTFSHSAEQTTMPVVAPTLMSKKEFAKEVCEHFEERCSYQFYNQSHAEVFTTSLLESLKNF